MTPKMGKIGPKMTLRCGEKRHQNSPKIMPNWSESDPSCPHKKSGAKSHQNDPITNPVFTHIGPKTAEKVTVWKKGQKQIGNDENLPKSNLHLHKSA